MWKQWAFCSLTITMTSLAIASSSAAPLLVQQGQDQIICNYFQDAAKKINGSDLPAAFSMFSSFRIVVDCIKEDYLYEFHIDQKRLPMFMTDEQFIRSRFIKSICSDAALWAPIFANGWSASYRFIGPDETDLGVMTVSNCDSENI